MAQKTTWDAAVLSESDINTYLMHEGGAFTSWTPTVTQSGSVTVTNTYSRDARSGRLISCWFYLTVTGSGTGSNAIFLGGLPATAASSGFVVGSGEVNDVSVPARYGALLFLGSTTAIEFHSVGSTANDNRLGVTSFTAGLAANDLIGGFFQYEATS